MFVFFVLRLCLYCCYFWFVFSRSSFSVMLCGHGYSAFSSEIYRR
jgi:hypothetical protein